MGIAAHLGLLVNVPTVGVAKSLLCGTVHNPKNVGDSEPILFHDRQIGVAYKSKRNAKPLYLSPGNLIDLPSAVALVKACLRGYRLPEPTRLAHNHVNLVRTTGKGLESERQETLL